MLIDSRCCRWTALLLTVASLPLISPPALRHPAASVIASIDTGRAALATTPITSTGCAPWQPVAGPSGTFAAFAAADASNLWAVGTSIAPATGTASATLTTATAIIAHGDGQHWNLVPTPRLAGATVRLNGVAANAATDAWAVGSSSTPRRPQRPLIEHWDGVQWSIVDVAPQAAPGYGAVLTAVAAASPADAWAVGGDDGPDRTLIEHWDGMRWRVVAGVPGDHPLNAVGIVAHNDVWAVGYNLIEHWDGTRWQTTPLPILAGSGATLSAIAVLSTRDLWVAGSYDTGGHTAPLLLHWDGHRWRVRPGVAVQRGLTALAAVSVGDVWAANETVVEHWDGVRWQEVPSPPGGLRHLVAVAPHNLWGVGTTFVQNTAPLCFAAPVSVRTLSAQHLGIQPYGEGTTVDGPGALTVDAVSEHAFVRDNSGLLTAIDLTGERQPQHLALGVSGAPALDAAGRRLFVPSAQNGGSVQVLNTRTMTVTATIPLSATPAEVAYDPASGRLVVATGSSVTIVNPATTARITMVAPGASIALALDSRTHRVLAVSGVGAVGAPQAMVLDLSSGAVVTTLSGLSGVPAVDEVAGLFYIAQLDAVAGTTAIRVRSLDATDGHVVRTVTVGESNNAYIYSAVVDPTHATLYLSTSLGLYRLESTTGALTQIHTALPPPTSLAVDAVAGRLYATYVTGTNQYGQPAAGLVAAYSTAQGVPLGMVTVGPGPDIVAYAPQSAQVFVLDQGGVQAVQGLGVGLTPAHNPSPLDPVAAQPGARYFPQSHHNLTAPFLAFWLRYGGVRTLGAPQSEAFIEGAHRVQYTDRARLEVVNEGVRLAPLGRLLTAGRRFPRGAPFSSTATRLYFPATGHSLSGRFLDYWQRHQGAALLGLPLSEVVVEGNNDGSGRRYPTQWFAYGRLEYHADLSGTPYAVEEGLLGVQALQSDPFTA